MTEPPEESEKSWTHDPLLPTDNTPGDTVTRNFVFLFSTFSARTSGVQTPTVGGFHIEPLQVELTDPESVHKVKKINEFSHFFSKADKRSNFFSGTQPPNF